jgi:hypothetical protein
MTKVKNVFAAILATMTVTMMISLTGCEKKTTEPETVQPITDDLFPLIVGRKLTFSGYLRDAATDVNIEATGAVYEARMTVAATNAPTPFGTAHVLSDSQRVPTGIPNPPTTWVVSSFYVQRAAPTGSGNFGFLTNIGRFYRTFGIQRADSLQWIQLIKQDAGVGVEWKGFDQTYTGAAGQVRLEIVCKTEARASLTLAGTTFNPYKVVAKRRVYLGGSATPSVQSETATIWLEPNVGIVKFIFNADGETPGFFREFKSKNF